jgi:uncharacterized membrane protein YbhN (UPF0104 family)
VAAEAGCRAAWTALRVSITAAAVAYVFGRLVDWSAAGAILARADPAGAAWLLLLGVPVLSAGLRWWWILRAMGIRATAASTTGLAWATMFFNLFLLGGSGGDVVRAWLVAREARAKGAVVASVVLDRMIGFGTMLLLGLTAGAVQWHRAELRGAAAALAVLAGAAAAAAVLYFSPWVRQWQALRGFLGRLPGAAWVREADRAVRAVGVRGGVWAGTVGLSAIGQVAHMMALTGLAAALGVGAGAGEIFAVAPVVFAVNAMPISIGGLGVGEAAAAALLAPAGVSGTGAITLVLAYRAGVLLWALPGAMIFALGRARPIWSTDGTSSEAGAPAESD